MDTIPKPGHYKEVEINEHLKVIVCHNPVEKTCKQIYHDHRQHLEEHFQQFRKDLETAAREEFPIGTKVSWKLPHRVEITTGEVTGRMADDPARITVRSNAGSGYTIHAWELTTI